MFEGLPLLIALLAAPAPAAQPVQSELDRAAALEEQAMALYQASDFLGAEALALEILAIEEAQLGSDDPAIAETLGALVWMRLNLGDTPSAVPLAERAVGVAEAAFGPDHLAYAGHAQLLADVLRDVGEFDRARTLYERALRIQERELGAEDPALALTLGGLALLEMDVAAYDRAWPLMQRALRLREAEVGPDHPLVARMLSDMGTLKRAQGDYAAALPLFTRAVEALERSQGKEHLALAPILNNLAGLLVEMGEYRAAEPHYQRALEIWQNTLGPDHPSVARALNNVGHLREALGHPKEALALYERSLRVWEANENPDPRGLCATIGNLAGVYESQGDLAAARRFAERAMRIGEDRFHPADPFLAAQHNNLATILQKQGDFVAARAMFARVLSVMEAAYGPEHPEVAVTLNNYAMLLRQQGDSAAARPLLERALRIRESAFGPAHDEVASGLINLAGILEDTGERDAAVPLYERALEIREAVLGPDAPALAAAIGALATLHHEQGRHEVAEALLQQALAIEEAQLGPRSMAVCTNLNNLASVTHALGRTAEAVALQERALAIAEEGLGPTHPDLADLRANLMVYLAATGAPVRALATQNLNQSADFLETLLPALSEREALAFVASRRQFLDGYIGIFDGEGDDLRAWSAVVAWKGAVARVLTHRARASANTAAAAELDQVRRQRARATLAGLQAGESADALAGRLDGLRIAQERLEREQAGDDAAFASDLSRRDAGPEEVCAALPADAVLIDTLRYQDGGASHYVAFVVSGAEGGCAVRRFELGDAASLDGLIRDHRIALAARDATGSPTTTARIDARGVRVYERVWAPLQAQVSSARHVLIAPDSALAEVSFAVLPTPEGRYLLEDVQLSTLESAADVLRWTAPPSPSEGALLVGDLDYGEVATAASRAAPCLEQAYGALPGTATELGSIARSWARHRRAAATVLTGQEADEGTVVEAMPGKQLIHFATHGFFAGAACRSALSGGDAIGFDPMVLSGIILASANTAQDPLEPRDGVLTAAEVSGLDLDGTALVVLSACETGLGEAHSGEGVLGLRRAFAATGARSLIMSLWAVPDQTTSALMAEMYERILHKRRPLGAAAALRAAQLERLAQSRRLYGDARPSDWGGFVAAGDWR